MKPCLTLAPRYGLANRIRAIGSAIELAKRINFELVIVWPLDAHLNCPYEYLFEPSSDFISVTDYDNRNETLETVYTTPDKFDKILTGKEVKVLKQEGFNFEELRSYKSVFISSFVAFIKTDPWPFRPEPSVAFTVSNVTSAFFENTIGVHIRRGDNKQSITYSPLESFIARMSLEADKNAATGFFLATDSPEEEARIRERFPGKVISFKKSSLDRNEPQAIREALVDLLCLSRTNKVIGSYWSSFSQLAANMGKIKLVEIRHGI